MEETELTSIKKRHIFWMDDPLILVRDNGYLNFIPDNNMTRVEQLNAITRFCIYAIILLLLFQKNYKWLYIPLIGIIGTALLYNLYLYDPRGKEKELYRQRGQRYEGFDPQKIIKDNIEYELESGYYDSNGKLHIGKEYTEKTQVPYRKIDYDLNEMLEFQKATCRQPTKDNPFMNPPVTDFNDGDKPVACNADDEDIKDKVDLNFNEGLYRDIQDLFDRRNSSRMFYTVPVVSIPSNQDDFAKWLYKSPTTCKEDNVKCLRYTDLRYER